MSARVRKLIGGVAMIAFVGFYALIAMALAQSRPLQEASALLQTLGYAVLGLAWTSPPAADQMDGAPRPAPLSRSERRRSPVQRAGDRAGLPATRGTGSRRRGRPARPTY